MEAKTRGSALAAVAAAFAAFAALAGVPWSGTEKQPLWQEGKIPDFQEHQIAALTWDANEKGFDRAAHRMPYLEWYPAPAKPNGGCMILISGGGYKSQCDVKLLVLWRTELEKLGFQCVNLVHRTPRPEGLPFYQSAWEDGQRAVRLVRSQAAKRGYDPEKIGVMSMSAGSHLATLLATSALTPAYAAADETDAVPCHVNWACPFAIAYAVTDGLGTPNSRAGAAVDAKLDSIFKFDEKTAPMCMMHGGKDIYSPTASTLVYRELRKRGVPAELHLFPDKPHGAFEIERAIEFMRQMGFLGPLEPEVDEMKRFDDSGRASYEKQPLWPEGKIPDFQKKQCVPYIEWHMPKTLATKAVQIIYSGGSYSGNTPDGMEVKPVRQYLNSKGMAVVTLKYRTPRPAAPLAKHTTAWQDVQRAVRLVRSQAAKRGLDPDRIGVMGSSAGGHLTLMAATSSRSQSYLPVDAIDKLPCNPQWGIAIYPAYALTDGLEAHNWTGGNIDSARLAPEFAFDPATPPMLFIHGDADGWAAMNSVKAWEQLRRMGIQGGLHTLALRKHCFQRKASPGTGSYTYFDRIWRFLTDKGFVGRKK